MKSTAYFAFDFSLEKYLYYLCKAVETKIYIKNMVCPRCVLAVEDALEEVGVKPIKVKLGEATLTEELTPEQTKLFNHKLNRLGFELLIDSKTQQIEQIKALVIEQISQMEENSVVFSELIANQLHKEYSQLSKLFSESEGLTIEQYIISQKIEKVKELLSYDEFTLSEMAHKLGYSSVAHLSAQFKKQTGLTPTQFKATGNTKRKSLDDI